MELRAPRAEVEALALFCGERLGVPARRIPGTAEEALTCGALGARDQRLTAFGAGAGISGRG